MPIPQVSDRIKEAPAVALRAVFAGVGQLLMAVDKIRAQMQEQARSPAPGQQRPSAAQPPGQTDGTSADRASNVTVLRQRATPAKPGAAAKSPGGAKQGAATKAAARPAAGTRPAADEKPAARSKSAAGAKPGAGTKPAAKAKPRESAAQSGGAKPAAAKPAPPAATAAPAAPIPGYDDLSVASLRARLRGLDAAGVQALLDYEKANARRGDVITMFERRLSKIENGAG